MYRTYNELILLQTFEERFDYLRLSGQCSEITFGGHRLLNQMLYRSPQWQEVRRRVIIRDNGCDLGIEDREIYGRIIIHHMNPISVEDVLNWNEDALFNPEFLICTMHNTHNAIHYGDKNLLMTAPIERSPNDTCPWKR